MDTKEKIAHFSLLAAVFFLPAGYDAVFKLIMDITGSYWIADLIFYFISFIGFSIFFYLKKINPVIYVKDYLHKVFISIKNFII